MIGIQYLFDSFLPTYSKQETQNLVNAMPARLFDMLNHARRQSFVGREREIRLFEGIAFSEVPQFYLLYFFGPGGQGKTTLIRRLMDLCQEREAEVLHLDAREIEAHPNSMLDHLRLRLQLQADEDPFEILSGQKKRRIIFIDTYEKLKPIDDWMRTDFLPQMPAHVFTVISGRNAPDTNWLSDPGWRALMKSVQLRNLSPDESAQYLAKRGAPLEYVKPTLEFTHGHPLALSMVADMFDQHPDKQFNPVESPDMVRALLEIFLQQVPGPAHKSALEICAMAYLTTQSLLEEVMGITDAGALFDWLRQLSFVEQGREGIYPHDLVREALAADVKWRHPDWYAELHEKVRNYCTKKLTASTGEAQRRHLFELIYLHRSNPIVRPFFDWQESGAFWVDLMQPSDLPAIESMIMAHEGEESLASFNYWAEQPCAQIWVWRDSQKAPLAFVLKLNLNEWKHELQCPDQTIQKLLEYQKKNLHLRTGEQWAVFRMWMTQDAHQQLSNLQSSIFLSVVQYYFTPGLAVSTLIVSYPEFWAPAFAYADLQLLSELNFQIGEKPFGWYLHDWRKRPILAWLELLGKREIDANASLDLPIESPQLQVIVLSEDEFGQSVSEALRSYHNRDELSNNPLVRSRLVIRHSGNEASVADRIAIFKQRVDVVMELLEESPVDGKFHRVLYRTFINPVGSQEKAADFLNMSFSTYRRYLKSGLERVTELLWREEIEG